MRRGHWWLVPLNKCHLLSGISHQCPLLIKWWVHSHETRSLGRFERLKDPFPAIGLMNHFLHASLFLNCSFFFFIQSDHKWILLKWQPRHFSPHGDSILLCFIQSISTLLIWGLLLTPNSISCSAHSLAWWLHTSLISNISISNTVAHFYLYSSPVMTFFSSMLEMPFTVYEFIFLT